MDNLELLVPLNESMDRIVATVSALSPADLAAQSGIPPWTRGHVITHIARNADSIVRLLNGAATAVETPQYSSGQARDAEIEAGAARPLDELVADLRGSFAAIDSAARALPVAAWSAPIQLRGGEPALASRLLALRLREQEIHHADIGAGYSFADIPASEVGLVILDIRTSAIDRGDTAPLRVVATDSDFTCEVGTGGPTVSGPQAELLGVAQRPLIRRRAHPGQRAAGRPTLGLGVEYVLRHHNPRASINAMTRYRFLDGMGDVVDEADFDDHTAALEWATDDAAEHDEEIQRVEYLGPEGDWRWAGALHG